AATLGAAIGAPEEANTVGPLSNGTTAAASVPSRAILARRFLVTFTAAPACFACLRRFCIWATVRPELRATTTTAVFLKTPLRFSTSSFFAARSTASSLRLAGLVQFQDRGPPVALAALSDVVDETGAGRRSTHPAP